MTLQGVANCGKFLAFIFHFVGCPLSAALKNFHNHNSVLDLMPLLLPKRSSDSRTFPALQPAIRRMENQYIFMGSYGWVHVRNISRTYGSAASKGMAFIGTPIRLRPAAHLHVSNRKILYRTPSEMRKGK